MEILSITILLCCLSIIKGLSDQFHVSCFRGCECNKTSIICNDLKEHSTDMFKHVLPEVYPDLDTLIVTGNNFGALVDENIFGSSFENNIRHRKLTLVNMSNNEIRSFGAQTFIGMPRVEYLYLSKNKLESVDSIDAQPFNYFTSLKYLDISWLFGQAISVTGRAKLLNSLLFNNNRSFIDLQDIDASSNGLEYLEPNTFCQVKGLTRLNLANNRLTAFSFNEGCFDNLHLLDLSGNKISSIPMSLLNNLPSIDTIDISGNPLNCDCDLADFHKFAINERNDFLNQQNTICAKPNTLAGKVLFDLDSLCHSSAHNSKILYVFLVFVIAVGGFVVYNRYRQWSFRNARMSSLLADMDGYSQLNAADEAISFGAQRQNQPPPVFV